jgi:hypothetical protein
MPAEEGKRGRVGRTSWHGIHYAVTCTPMALTVGLVVNVWPSPCSHYLICTLQCTALSMLFVMGLHSLSGTDCPVCSASLRRFRPRN